jgi:5'-deoxynucleotidase YfbR-like HD superfamily hydrolase
MNAPLRPVLPIDHVRVLISQMSIADLMRGTHSDGYPDRIGYFQYTHTGRLFWSCDPRPEEVFIEDIATQLARVPRFGGGCVRNVSVAEHSWIASFVGSEEEALERLLHDAPEAYIGDLIRPLKALPVYSDVYLRIEDGIMKAIAERYRLQYPFPRSVKYADEYVVGGEIAQNIDATEQSSQHIKDRAARIDGAGVRLYYWSADVAKHHFLQRFYELAEKRGLRGMAV